MGKKERTKPKKKEPKAKKPEKGTMRPGKEPKVSYYLRRAIFRGHVVTLLEQDLIQCAEDLHVQLERKRIKIENVHDPKDLNKFFPQEWDREQKKGSTKLSFLEKKEGKNYLKEGVLFSYEFLGKRFILITQKILNNFDPETKFGDVPFTEIKKFLADPLEFKEISKEKVDELKAHFKARVKEKEEEKEEVRSEHLPKIGAEEKEPEIGRA